MHLEMQVGAGGMTFVSHQGDLLTSRDGSSPDREDPHVPVKRLDTIPVLQHNLVPKAGGGPGVEYITGGGGHDGSAEWRGDVKPEMTLGAGGGVETAGDRPDHRWHPARRHRIGRGWWLRRPRCRSGRGRIILWRCSRRGPARSRGSRGNRRGWRQNSPQRHDPQALDSLAGCGGKQHRVRRPGDDERHRAVGDQAERGGPGSVHHHPDTRQTNCCQRTDS